MTLRNVLAELQPPLRRLAGNPHPHLLGEQFDQHHDAALAIGHLVDAFDASKGHFGQTDPFAGLKQAFWLSLHRRLLRPKGFDRAVGHLGRLHPKADQAANALGRADGCPTGGRISLAQANVLNGIQN